MKILIFTVGYNCEKTMRRTIESVLSQTYSEFEYHFVNNGCTDGSAEILAEYAEKDNRFIVHTREKNHTLTGEVHPTFTFLKKQIENADDYYITNLDADDWLEPTCFEKLIGIAVNDDCDIIATGYTAHFQSDGRKESFSVDIPISMTKEEFSDYYAVYHKLFRPIWGKLYKVNVIKKAMDMYVENDHVYGMDTYFTFLALRNAEKVYLDDSALLNYFVHRDSDSYKEYTPKRKESDLFLFNDAIDFLSQYGEISIKNMLFIYMVYANAIKDTVVNLINSKLSAEEKLKEYLEIFARVETQNALLIKNESIDNVRYELLSCFLSFVTDLKKDFNKVQQIFKILAPNCYPAINDETIKLFARSDEFKKMLLTDDKDLLVTHILALILKGDRLTKVYDFPFMLCALAKESSPASTIKNEEFIKLYIDVYALIWKEENIKALEKMTEILFSGNELNCPEDFLNLYVTLAALENHVEAFLFGNIQKAYLFIDEKRLDEAKQIVNDLVEMGAGETDDVVELQRLLEK